MFSFLSFQFKISFSILNRFLLFDQAEVLHTRIIPNVIHYYGILKE